MKVCTALAAGVTLISAAEPPAVELEYRREQQESLENLDPFSLLGGDSAFRAHPPVTDGKVGLMTLTLRWNDARFDRLAGELGGCLAGRGLRGDFNYQAIRARLLPVTEAWPTWSGRNGIRSLESASS